MQTPTPSKGILNDPNKVSEKRQGRSSTLKREIKVSILREFAEKHNLRDKKILVAVAKTLFSIQHQVAGEIVDEALETLKVKNGDRSVLLSVPIIDDGGWQDDPSEKGIVDEAAIENSIPIVGDDDGVVDEVIEEEE